MTLPGLSVEAILDNAKHATGLSDFGDESFVEALSKLIDCLNAEAQLNAGGNMMLQQVYTQLLVNRLRFEDDLKKHPEILEEKLSPPIFVVGLPRSGTTKLHRVLSAQVNTQSLPLWQVINPVPFPDTPADGPDPRIGFAQAMIASLQENFPDTLAGHPMDAMAAEEESQTLMEMTFDGPLVPVRAHVPGFAQWRWQRSLLPCYQYFYRLLQYLQWQNKLSGSSACRFILKSPLHLGHINELTQVFPGALIVHCHRDPLDSVPSFARLLEVGWAMVTDRHELEEFGRESLNLLSSHMDRYLQQRNEQDNKVTFVDVQFQDIVKDAITVARTVYKHYGMSITAETEARIRDWEAENPPTRYGKHSYSLEHYGLSSSLIRERFASYYARFLE